MWNITGCLVGRSTVWWMELIYDLNGLEWRLLDDKSLLNWYIYIYNSKLLVQMAKAVQSTFLTNNERDWSDIPTLRDIYIIDKKQLWESFFKGKKNILSRQN